MFLPAYAGSNLTAQKVYINADCQTNMRFRIVSGPQSQIYALLSQQDSITEAKVYNGDNDLIFVLHVRELSKDTCIFEGAQYVYNPILSAQDRSSDTQNQTLTDIFYYENNILVRREGFLNGKIISKEPIAIGDTVYLAPRASLIPMAMSDKIPDYVASRTNIAAYGIIKSLTDNYCKMHIFSTEDNKLIRVSQLSSSPYANKPTYSGNQYIFYPSGKVKTTLVYDEHNQIVSRTDLYESGQPSIIYYYTKPIQTKAFYENGALRMETKTDSVSHQVYTQYYLPDGTPIDNPDEEEDSTIFVKVEKMPEFPGGQQGLFNYLSKNVHYPKIARQNKIEGRVICQFVVNKDGSIVDVEVVRSGGDPSLDKEAVRVIRSMPKWIPGQKDGKPVRVKYTVPLNFKL